MWASHAQLSFHTCDGSHCHCTRGACRRDWRAQCSESVTGQHANTKHKIWILVYCLYIVYTGHCVFYIGYSVVCCSYPVEDADNNSSDEVFRWRRCAVQPQRRRHQFFLCASTWIISRIVFSTRKKWLLLFDQSTNQTGCQRITHCTIFVLFIFSFH